MSRFTSFSLREDASAKDDHPTALPDISDLSARIRFSPHDGQIWLDDQRVVLFNMEWLVTMRRELIEGLGPRKARETLFRMGHAAGTREAMIALKVRNDRPEIDAFLVGPQLHALRGEVHVEPVTVEGDVESGTYFSELVWRNSSEAEAHVRCSGGSHEPVCWMQLGYATGYTSALMERPILFREIECVACGDPVCRIIGRPQEEWPEEANPVTTQHAFLPPVGEVANSGGTPDGVVGTSPGFLGAWYLLKRVAPTSTTVFIQGETGVGKEVFARAVHDESPRSGKQMYIVNCAAIPESLVDAELFGVERGAFTGAYQSRPGWFEVADGSTLFLDEIGTLNATAQAKLLRVIQEGQFNRVGGTTTRTVDVRLVCATNLDLEVEVEKGHFRLDLLHRLNIFPITIPPLRERRDDIPLLIQYFLNRFSLRNGRKLPGFTAGAVDTLLQYDFPGNVRELQNMIERAGILSLDDEPIDTFHIFHGKTRLEKTFLTPMHSGSLTERAIAKASQPRLEDGIGHLSLAELEAIAIREALASCDGNISKAARKLGLTRSKLRYRLRDPSEIAG